ncbi:unnamed protein product [Amoebophrya sp. A120]|nr:unnamed protein product [Amoebophrya sp. A120]|eukprot:GSA120T00006764001.1
MPARFFVMSLVCHLSTVAVVSASLGSLFGNPKAGPHHSVVAGSPELADYRGLVDKLVELARDKLVERARASGPPRVAEYAYQVYGATPDTSPQLAVDQVEDLLSWAKNHQTPWLYFFALNRLFIYKDSQTPDGYWTISQRPAFGITLEYKSGPMPLEPSWSPAFLTRAHKLFLAAVVINGGRHYQEHEQLQFTVGGFATESPRGIFRQDGLRWVAARSGKNNPWRTHWLSDTFLADFRELNYGDYRDMSIEDYFQLKSSMTASMITSYATKSLEASARRTPHVGRGHSARSAAPAARCPSEGRRGQQEPSPSGATRFPRGDVGGADSSFPRGDSSFPRSDEEPLLQYRPSARLASALPRSTGRPGSPPRR